MAGLYIHVPFCNSKCSYCGFYSAKMNLEAADRYLARITDDLVKILPKYRADIDTVFIGGGNPLALNKNQLEKLLEAVQKQIDPAAIKEFSVEGNPENLNKEKAQLIASLPGARLSMGAQRLRNEELQILGRNSSVETIYRAFDLALSVLDNVSADFILGIGGCESIAGDLKSFIQKFQIRHVSAYFLSIEPGTEFCDRLMRSEIIDPADLGPEEFYQVKAVLEEHGFEHYEISNYALPEYRCLHNENYWKLGDYVGIGPAAVGTVNGLRTHNVADIKRWLENEAPVIEQLTQIDKRNEFVMLGLRRLKDGISLTKLERKFGAQPESFYAELFWHQEQGNLEITQNKVRITNKGIAIADSIIGALFI